jgi:uncharacterized membrane protein YraQ (UPF0718 family)
MMCSACSVPVALGWKQRGANIGTTLGVVMGASLLNIMGLVTIFVLFPGPAVWGRMIASLMLVVIFTPLIVKLATRVTEQWLSPDSVKYFTKNIEESEPDSSSVLTDQPGSESWETASVQAVKKMVEQQCGDRVQAFHTHDRCYVSGCDDSLTAASGSG